MKKTLVGHMHNVLMLMNAVLDYTIAIKKLNVQTLKDPIAVNVNEVLLAMENILVLERMYFLM
jgi:small nuclear ribonucleoprotein (snRNP)-like protein